MGKNSVNLGNVEQGGLLSWSETVKDNKLLLQIEGRIERSEKDVVDTICVLSVVNDRYFFIIDDKYAEERKKENSCQGKSKVKPRNNGSWDFKNDFQDQNYRIIRVEKIYKQNKVSESRSYIVFTIGRS